MYVFVGVDDGYSRVMDSSSHAFGGDIENDDGVENDENNGSPHEGEHDQKKGVLKGRGSNGSNGVSVRDNGSNGSSGGVGGGSGNGTRNGSSRGNPTFASEDDDDELCIADVAYALDSDDDEIERDMKAMRGEDHGVGSSEGQVSSQQQQQQQPTNSSAATTITTTANSSSSSSSSSSSNNSKNNNNNNNTTTESSNQFYSSFFSEEEEEDDDVTHTNTGDLPSLLIL